MAERYIVSSYHNTTRERGRALRQFEEKARSQDSRILRFFQTYLFGEFTPEEVRKHTSLDCPLTSVRRSMTNLTKVGRLIKTGRQEESSYGRPAYCWRLNATWGG